MRLLRELNRSNKSSEKILEGSELYSEATVSFSLCQSGSTPVFSPYTEHC